MIIQEQLNYWGNVSSELTAILWEYQDKIEHQKILIGELKKVIKNLKGDKSEKIKHYF